MADVRRLMGLGMAPELAKRVGFFVDTVENTTLRGPGNYMVRVSTSATVQLSGFDIGDQVVICAAAGAVSVAPDAASVIWPTSAGVAHQVTAGVAKTFLRLSNTEWWIMTSA